MGLVGLYACKVKRLRSEKRIAANFFSSCIWLYCFAPALCVLRLYCFCCFAPVVCGFLLGCCFFFPLDGMTKRKGKRWLVLSSWVVGLLYTHKLVQIVSGFAGSKISPSGCGVLYLAGSPAYFSEIAIFHGFACFNYFDFDAAPVTYCERGGWCKSCHIVSCFCGLLLFVCYMFSAAFIASSLVFEKIHPAPQVRCALNLPPKLFKVSLIARVSPITAIAFSE